MSFMELKDFEDAIFWYLGNSEDITPEMYAHGFSVKQQIYSNLEGLQYCVENYTKFSYLTSRLFTFQCISLRVKEFFDDIPAEMKEPIIQIIFRLALSQYSEHDNNIAYALAEAQAQYAIHTYLSEWPNIWETLFGMEENAFLKFASRFCYLVYMPTPEDFDQIILLKRQILSSDIGVQILEKIQAGIYSKNPDAFLAFSSFLRWINLDWLNDERFTASILEGFDSQETFACTISVYDSLLKRVDANMKIDIIQQFQYIDKFNLVLQSQENQPNNEVLIALGNLLQTLGFNTIGTEYTPVIMNLCFPLMLYGDDNVSDTILSFITYYTQNSPDDVSLMVQNAFQRLVTNFQQNQFPGATPISERLSRIIFLAYQINQAVVIEVLQAIIVDNDVFSDMYLAAAVLVVIVLIYENENFPIYYNKFIPLFEQDPLQCDLPTFLVIYQFLKIPISINNNQRSFQYFKETYSTILRFATAEIDPAIRSIFSKEFLQFTLKKAKYLNYPNDIIPLVQLNDPIFTEAASYLTQGVLENNHQRTDIILQVIQHLQSILQESVEEDTLQVAVSFLIGITEPTIDSIQTLLDFMNYLLPLCQQYEPILAKLIKCFINFDLLGFEIFLQNWPQFLQSRFTITSIAEVASYYIEKENLKIQQRQQHEPNSLICSAEWKIMLSDAIIDQFMQICDYIQTYPPNKDEFTKEISPMVKNCFRFFSDTFNVMSEETSNKVIFYAKKLLTRKFDSLPVLDSINHFMCAVFRKNPTVGLEELLPSSLNFLYRPIFDPFSRSTCFTIINTFRTHASLHKNIKSCYQELFSVVNNALSSFGISKESCDRYTLLWEGDQKNIMQVIPQLYVDFLIERDQMTWT